jgi:hypothetical protein
MLKVAMLVSALLLLLPVNANYLRLTLMEYGSLDRCPAGRTRKRTFDLSM